MGHALLHINQYNEDYVITLPSFQVKGLLSGKPYTELERQGMSIHPLAFPPRLNTRAKAGSQGRRITAFATLYRNEHEQDLSDPVAGQWTDELTIRDLRMKQSFETYRIHEHKINALTVAKT